MLQGRGNFVAVARVRKAAWPLVIADGVLAIVAWRERSLFLAVAAITLTTVLLGAPPSGSVGRWLLRYRWLVGAFVFGALNTGVGIYHTYFPESTKLWLGEDVTEFVHEWSPHFGPEALVLVFTVAYLRVACSDMNPEKGSGEKRLVGFCS